MLSEGRRLARKLKELRLDCLISFAVSSADDVGLKANERRGVLGVGETAEVGGLVAASVSATKESGRKVKLVERGLPSGGSVVATVSEAGVGSGADGASSTDTGDGGKSWESLHGAGASSSSSSSSTSV